jgi:hypothetical protein
MFLKFLNKYMKNPGKFLNNSFDVSIITSIAYNGASSSAFFNSLNVV